MSGATTGTKTNFQRMREVGAIDAQAAAAMLQHPDGQAAIARLNALDPTKVDNFVEVHQVASPGKPFRPDPDGSIF